MSAEQRRGETPCQGGTQPTRSPSRPQIRSDEHPVLKPGTINEPRESWVVHALKALGLTSIFALGQAGVLAALVFIASLVLQAQGVDGGTKIAGVTVVALAIAILGMANLLLGSKSNATSAKDEADQSADSRTGGGGA